MDNRINQRELNIKLVIGLLFVLIASILLIPSCKQDPKKTGPSTPSKTVDIPKFSGDTAYQKIVDQLAFGPRVPGTQEHVNCKDWLVSQLKSYGAEVIEQNFTTNASYNSAIAATNVIGQFNPKMKNRMVLAAHWDTRYTSDAEEDKSKHDLSVPGADDGASGVAVLLEIARLLNETPINMGIDIVLFDMEDQGNNDDQYSWGKGAQHWSNNLHKPGYRPKYGILLDMVGSKNARFGKEAYSLRYAKPQVDKIWQLAQNMGYSDLFVNDNVGAVTDDHFFVNSIAGIPMLDIINKPLNSESGFGPHWHTQDDDIDVINKRTLRVVGQIVTTVIYRESIASI